MASLNEETADGILVDYDINEPTMGEKLALNFPDNDKVKSHEEEEPSGLAKPPRADSVHVMLKQALRADDRSLMLDCLYTKDEKVISKSVSLLNSSDVLKLLAFLMSIVESSGAIIACALPWLRSLLLQHSSEITSQESSLFTLNSLYQLIEARVSTFQSALQLSSSIDFLCRGTRLVDEDEDEKITTIPVIYEDKDESDESESEDGMETDQDEGEEGVDNLYEVEESSERVNDSGY